MPGAGTKQRQILELATPTAATSVPSATNPSAPAAAAPTHKSPDEILSDFAQFCVALPATGALIAVRDLAGLRCSVSFGNAPAVGSRLPADSALLSECLDTGEVALCDDAEIDPRIPTKAARFLGFRSAAVVPILAQGSVVGVIEAFCFEPSGISADAVQGFQLVAQSFARQMVLHAANGGDPVVGGSLTEPIALPRLGVEETPLPAAPVLAVPEPTVAASIPEPAVSQTADQSPTAQPAIQAPIQVAASLIRNPVADKIEKPVSGKGKAAQAVRRDQGPYQRQEKPSRDTQPSRAISTVRAKAAAVATAAQIQPKAQSQKPLGRGLQKQAPQAQRSMKFELFQLLGMRPAPPAAEAASLAQLPSDRPTPSRVWLLAGILLLVISLLLIFLLRGATPPADDDSDSSLQRNSSPVVFAAAATPSHRG
jgi:hypothetical protein